MEINSTFHHHHHHHHAPSRVYKCNLQIKTCGPIFEHTVQGLGKMISEMPKNDTFYWRSEMMADLARHGNLVAVSIYSVKDKGPDLVKLELHIQSPSPVHSYAHSKLFTSWSLNIGTISAPDAFFDATRSFDKSSERRVVVDVGTVTQFIETLQRSKDIIIFTLFIRHHNDPDISTLHEQRHQQQSLNKSLSSLLSIHSRSFNDPCPESVRFVFPQRSGRKKYLYALESVLRSAKYFTDLLDSQFSETNWSSGHSDSPSSAKRPRLDPESAPATAAVPEQSTSNAYIDPNLESGAHGLTDNEQPTWWNGDSDDESDDPAHDVEEYEMPSERFKATIVVTDTPYTTYRALLKYLFSGSISFAPLRSTYLVEQRAARKKGEDFEGLQGFIQRHSTPIVTAECDLTPASPKSIYVLADKLIMPELQKLAKQQILSSLTPSNIFNEIKTDMCLRYPELRAMYTKYLKEHRDEAISSDLLQEIIFGALCNSTREVEDVLRDALRKSPTPASPLAPPKPPIALQPHHMSYPSGIHNNWNGFQDYSGFEEHPDFYDDGDGDGDGSEFV